MNRRTTASMLAGVLIVTAPALAADVTPERLVNADREPQSWLMNHRTYDAQRYSPLDKINKGNVKDLKLAYAVAIGGTSVNDNLEESLEQLWEINVGTGINAPPMTFEAGGKQYVAILTGLSRNARTGLVNTPELREMRNQTMLFVFGL
jgi:glucose dehydrogenase